MMKMYADREDPSWKVGWYDGEGVLRDFSVGFTFRLEFLSTRNERLIHTKTDGIAGADTEPNVVTSWAVGELASLAGHKYKLRLVAVDVLGRESVFREEQLPTCEIMAAPEA